jgi:hypothetical protein
MSSTIQIICLNCKKTFYDYKSNHRKYCGRKCLYISKLNKIPWNKGTIGLMVIPWNKGKKLSKEHKEKLRQAKLKNPVRYWLGKVKPRGEDSPLWKGGISRNVHSLTSPDYKNWRKLVFERDNYKCKINNKDCKGQLQAHHILRWADYPELRYEINNGITLCQAHHPRKKAEEKRLIPIFNELVSVSN